VLDAGCYVWVPSDEADAKYAMMPSGLKMSANSGPARLPGKGVYSRLRWAYLRFVNQTKDALKGELFR
jgi:hypothetical protein